MFSLSISIVSNWFISNKEEFDMSNFLPLFTLKYSPSTFYAKPRSKIEVNIKIETINFLNMKARFEISKNFPLSVNQVKKGKKPEKS